MLTTVYIRKPIRIVSRQIQLLRCFHLHTSSQNTSVKLAALWPMAFTEYSQSSCKQLSLKKHSGTRFRIPIFLCPYVPGASHFSLSLPSVPRDFREASRRWLALDPIGLSPLGHLMRFTQFSVRYCFFTTR